MVCNAFCICCSLLDPFEWRLFTTVLGFKNGNQLDPFDMDEQTGSEQNDQYIYIYIYIYMRSVTIAIKPGVANDI